MKMTHIARGAFLIVLLLIGHIGHAQRSILYDSAYLPALEPTRASVLKFMERNRVPGMSITIAKEGKLLWSEGFGVINEATGTKATTQSMFRVGSVFKPVTALGLLKLVGEGKIGLDDKIVKYLPNLPKQYRQVTVRQLATHTAGVRHYRQRRAFNEGIRKYGSMMASLEKNPEFKAEILSNIEYNSVEESLGAFINDKLIAKPGTQFRYSTYGYVLLGAVLEKAAGKPFNQFIKEEVLDPLEMHQTRPDIKTDNDENKATPYLYADKLLPVPEVNLSNKWSGGGYVSSSLDITKMANALKQFISEPLYQEMIKPVKLKNGGTAGYGLGWKLAEQSNGGTALYHDGFTPGGSAVIIIFRSLTVCITTNQTTIVSPQHAADIAIPFFELKK